MINLSAYGGSHGGFIEEYYFENDGSSQDSGTITVPANATLMGWIMCGGGGGGGGGRYGDSGEAGAGGGGGSGGAINTWCFARCTPGASIAYLVGNGGAGGTGQNSTTYDSNWYYGSHGTAGTSTQLSGHMTCGGGGRGNRGGVNRGGNFSLGGSGGDAGLVTWNTTIVIASDFWNRSTYEGDAHSGGQGLEWDTGEYTWDSDLHGGDNWGPYSGGGSASDVTPNSDQGNYCPGGGGAASPFSHGGRGAGRYNSTYAVAETPYIGAGGGGGSGGDNANGGVTNSKNGAKGGAGMLWVRFYK